MESSSSTGEDVAGARWRSVHSPLTPALQGKGPNSQHNPHARTANQPLTPPPPPPPPTTTHLQRDLKHRLARGLVVARQHLARPRRLPLRHHHHFQPVAVSGGEGRGAVEAQRAGGPRPKHSRVLKNQRRHRAGLNHRAPQADGNEVGVPGGQRHLGTAAGAALEGGRHDGAARVAAAAGGVAKGCGRGEGAVGQLRLQRDAAEGEVAGVEHHAARCLLLHAEQQRGLARKRHGRGAGAGVVLKHLFRQLQAQVVLCDVHHFPVVDCSS